jgi:RNA polymerase sigma-70 factor (ECF subfamily)
MTALTAYPAFQRLGYDEECKNQETRSAILANQQAMGQFLAGIEKRAYRIARMATGDGEEALDIVQDTMFKLVEKYQRKSQEEWPALFYSILQSRIRDWYRRNKVRRAVMGFLATSPESDVDPIQEVEDSYGRTPDYNLQMERTVGVLESAIQALPLRQQQAFLLRVWEGLDVRETALAMGCSDGSVKTHFSRAVHNLREKLGDHWSPDSRLES